MPVHGIWAFRFLLYMVQFRVSGNWFGFRVTVFGPWANSFFLLARHGWLAIGSVGCGYQNRGV